jgi:hypothetical protein
MASVATLGVAVGGRRSFAARGGIIAWIDARAGRLTRIAIHRSGRASEPQAHDVDEESPTQTAFGAERA